MCSVQWCLLNWWETIVEPVTQQLVPQARKQHCSHEVTVTHSNVIVIPCMGS